MSATTKINTILFRYYNLRPLDIYNGTFQVYCIKPEGKYILKVLICNRTHTRTYARAHALLLFQGLLVSSKFVFNVPPKAKAILRHGHSLGPHPIGWRSQGLSSGYLGTRRVVSYYTTAAPTSATP